MHCTVLLFSPFGPTLLYQAAIFNVYVVVFFFPSYSLTITFFAFGIMVLPFLSFFSASCFPPSPGIHQATVRGRTEAVRDFAAAVTAGTSATSGNGEAGSVLRPFLPTFLSVSKQHDISLYRVATFFFSFFSLFFT